MRFGLGDWANSRHFVPLPGSQNDTSLHATVRNGPQLTISYRAVPVDRR
jgi:hypothetical protein